MTFAFDRDGFAILERVIPSALASRLRADFGSTGLDRSERSGEMFGARNVLDIASVAELGRLPAVRDFVSQFVGEDAAIVRGIFFDKTPGANWPVAWHQDLTLALAARVDIDGWRAWSVKAGVTHVQPPVHILEQMVTLRFHLDPCRPQHGPLRVVPASHRGGRLDRTGQSVLRARLGEKTICVDEGDVIAMRPLILHASSAALAPNHRRVVHLEYAPTTLLPAALNWHKALR